MVAWIVVLVIAVVSAFFGLILLQGQIEDSDESIEEINKQLKEKGFDKFDLDIYDSLMGLRRRIQTLEEDKLSKEQKAEKLLKEIRRR